MLDMRRVCRACLVEKDLFDYFLFINVSSEEFKYFTSIEVSNGDIFPTSLCNTCHDFLKKMMEFKKMCMESQSILMRMKSSSLLLHERINETSKAQLKPDNIYDVDIPEKNEESVNEKVISIKCEYDGDRDNGYDFSETNFCLDTKIDKPRPQTRLQNGVKCKHGKLGLKLKAKRHFKFTCETCNRKFNYPERFEAHKLEHEGKVLPIHCTDCNKQFMTWSGLRRHTETEHSVVSLKSLRCSSCGKICKSRQTLQMHSKLHNGRMKWICHVCGKWCATSYNLKLHQETHKETRDKSFTCEHCGKKFFSNNLLKAHARKLHQKRRYLCYICNFPFKAKHNLATHLLIHDGKKLHSCNVCDKSFGSRSTLVEHARIHSGERPYSCLYCPKRFLSKRRLTDHHRTHTGERPYKCNICERGYTQRGSLKRHMKIHIKSVITQEGT